MIDALTELPQVLQEEKIGACPSGEIFALGGNTSDEVENVMFGKVKPGDIVDIMPLAGSDPPHTFEAYKEILQKEHGAISEHLYRDECRKSEYAVKTIRDAQDLYLTGGNQQLIFENVNSQIHEAIIAGYMGGKNLWTVSAGTAALGDLCLYGYGDSKEDDPPVDDRAQKVALKTVRSVGRHRDIVLKALGIVPGTIWDTHMDNGENRIERLEGAVEAFPDKLGIGVDEDTGVHIVRGDECTVYGTGKVHLVRYSRDGGDKNRPAIYPFEQGQKFRISEFLPAPENMIQ